MKNTSQLLSLKIQFDQKRIFKFLLVISAVFLFVIGAFQLFSTSAQTNSNYKIGERLTYNISFDKFENAAYAEIYVESRGKLEGKDAIELSAKLKSFNLVSAAFYLFDESRSTFVNEQSGLPLYVRNISKTSGLPKEKISNFLNSPTTNYDLLSMIYKVRNAGGAGSFSVQENENIYNFDFAASGGESVKIDDREFETTISTVQSSFLTELGITNFRINFSNDENRIPVQIRFKTEKGNFTAKIASIQNLEPPTTPTETTTSPIVVNTPTRTPTPTPTPYIDNQPISTELPFVLGETLEFQVINGTQNVGKVILQVKERKEFDGEDRLLIIAGVSDSGQENVFNIQDLIEAQVDPFTLVPSRVNYDFKSSFRQYNQIADFDQELGIVEFNGGNRVDIPIGTHSLLSLAYAIRNFNLKPSLDLQNPINDTRVAIFLGSQFYVLTLRPSNTTFINQDGKKIPAQLISVSTDNQTINQLNVRLWLSNDKQRLPLRFSIGTYQADLISNKIIQPK